MITFHPASRKTAAGFVPMVTVRAAKGRMIGSKIAQNGNVYASAAEAKAFAIITALRVAMQFPETMTVAR